MQYVYHSWVSWRQQRIHFRIVKASISLSRIHGYAFTSTASFSSFWMTLLDGTANVTLPVFPPPTDLWGNGSWKKQRGTGFVPLSFVGSGNPPQSAPSLSDRILPTSYSPSLPSLTPTFQVHACLCFQHPGGWGRKTLSSRSLWAV